MSAGAVPIVFANGGQVEIVEDGVNGFHFTSIEGLVAATRRLTDDDGLFREMARAAAERAGDFTMPRFRARVEALVAEVIGRAGATPSPE
jgi:glycosyltransferase involved in cell wall biosynthesis